MSYVVLPTFFIIWIFGVLALVSDTGHVSFDAVKSLHSIMLLVTSELKNICMYVYKKF